VIRLALDPRARVLNGGRTIIGGDPPRVLRLTRAGAEAVNALRMGTAAPRPGLEALGRRLVDAGLAHPLPRPAETADVTIVIPVRDRAAALSRCLKAISNERPVIVVDDGSRDAGSIAAVCERNSARLIRRSTPGGPAAARNAGLAAVDTELVAFLDSDCVPQGDWLELLCGALSDPTIGAVAPQLRAVSSASDGVVARFAIARSPLEFGLHAADVRPGGRISYVPSAALLVRRTAVVGGFDERLRYGEDVDLVWRMHDAGWRIRYEPAAVVHHEEPAGLTNLLKRRFRYGTGAGQLANRHPGRLAPLVIHPRPAVVVAFAIARAPRLATLAMAVHVAATSRRLRTLDVPQPVAASLATRGVTDSAVAIGRAATMLVPGLLMLGLARRRTRAGALMLLLAEPLRSWKRSRPRLDPVRWTFLAVADDIAYGAGVWTGAAAARTLRPVRPGLTGLGFGRGARDDLPNHSQPDR
jgi:mycofactocin glycosyltransferase